MTTYAAVQTVQFLAGSIVSSIVTVGIARSTILTAIEEHTKTYTKEFLDELTRYDFVKVELLTFRDGKKTSVETKYYLENNSKDAVAARLKLRSKETPEMRLHRAGNRIRMVVAAD